MSSRNLGADLVTVALFSFLGRFGRPEIHEIDVDHGELKEVQNPGEMCFQLRTMHIYSVLFRTVYWKHRLQEQHKYLKFVASPKLLTVLPYTFK